MLRSLGILLLAFTIRGLGTVELSMALLPLLGCWPLLLRLGWHTPHAVGPVGFSEDLMKELISTHRSLNISWLTLFF